MLRKKHYDLAKAVFANDRYALSRPCSAFFFDKSNFKGWPEKIEQVVYHWGNDKQRFIDEVKRKKIDVLIGNVPATAYETFREIARALPGVKFIPTLDSQFSNKSKENVTHFCHKYQLPIPKTEIFFIRLMKHWLISTTPNTLKL